MDVRSFQNDMTSISSKDDVLTLLIHPGYRAYETETRSVYIPNEEIRQEFISISSKEKFFYAHYGG